MPKPLAEEKPLPLTTPAPKALPAGAFEDVVMVRDGKGSFNVVLAKFIPVGGSEKLLEKGVEIHVARQAVILWRAKNRGLAHGLV